MFKIKQIETKIYKVYIPIIRKNYNSTRSAKFKGEIEIITNDKGIIFDWKIYFSEIYLDVLRTASWPKNYIKVTNRNILFERFESQDSFLFIQSPRLSKSDNRIIKLNKFNISVFNNFINELDEKGNKKFCSTVKGVLLYLKGNNPSGEMKNPNNAEIIIDRERTTKDYKNFCVLIDDLSKKIKFNINTYDCLNINANSINFDKFINMNPVLANALNILQKNKDYSDKILYKNAINEYVRENNYWSQEVRIPISDCKRSRAKFGTNVDDNLTEFPFGFKSKDEFQKCHLLEFKYLSSLAVDAYFNKGIDSPEYKLLIYKIQDSENFLPMEESIHRMFDKNYFSYNEQGNVFALNLKGNNLIQRDNFSRYKKIEKKFLTIERVRYLTQRNEINKNT